MKNRNSLLALAAGISCGGLAFFLLYQKAAELGQKSTPIAVLTASRYIPAGSFLKPDMVEKKMIPESFVSPSAIRSLQEIEGLTSLVPLSAGEQVLSNKFGERGQSLALSLNPGYRAYSLAVNETTGVGGLLRPGNRIDLLAKFESEKREITSFVFQDLQVLAVGQTLDMVKQRDNPNSTETPENSGYSTVTLAVTPEQAETLMYLEGQSLRLVLRAPNDDEIATVQPRSGSEVLAQLGRFNPRPKSHAIEVIHGDSKGE